MSSPPGMHAQSLESCPTLCNPTDCSPPGSSVREILQARILEWVALPPPRDLPDPGLKPASPALQQILYHLEPPEKPRVLPQVSVIFNCLTVSNRKILVSQYVTYHNSLLLVFNQCIACF